jgi:hypothetical protein
LPQRGIPRRIDSSAPHPARLMMLPGWPGAIADADT